MIAQSFGANELLLAADALVDPVVQPLVHLEVGCAVQPLLTYVALVLLLSCMRLVMALQAGQLRETLGTNFTFVGAFAGMEPQMCI